MNNELIEQTRERQLQRRATSQELADAHRAELANLLANNTDDLIDDTVQLVFEYVKKSPFFESWNPLSVSNSECDEKALRLARELAPQFKELVDKGILVEILKCTDHLASKEEYERKYA